MQDEDIDSQQFDAHRYVRNYLKSNSVQDLLRHHNKLQGEIKDYDQEIQTLVFENYSKFISSIDTVRKMKHDIQNVDSKMSKLTESMDRIASLSKRIESSLSVKRDEIIKLDTVNKDLSKLNNICNFPHIIQKEIDAYYKVAQKGKKVPINFDDHFNETASYYKQCFAMLDNYKLEPLIQPIHRETTQRLEQVRQILWSALMEFKQQNPLLQLYQHPDQIQISTQEARSAVKKLIYIMEDEEAVLKHYQKMIKERYLTITKELIDKATISKMVSGGFRAQGESTVEPNNQIDQDLLKFIEEKYYECPIEDLEDFKQRKEKEYVNADSSVQGSLLWLINQLCQVIFRELRVEVGFLLIEVRAALREKSHEVVAEQCIKEIIHGVFQGVTEKMSQRKINNFQVNEVFKKLQSELQSLFQRSEIRPQLKTEIIDKFTENVENICRGQVLTSFNQLRFQFLECQSTIRKGLVQFDLVVHQRSQDGDFLELEGEVKRELLAQVTKLKQRLQATLLIRLVDLKAFVFQQQESYLREQQTYIHLIQASLVDFCRFVVQVFRMKDVSQESLTNLSLMDQNVKDKQQALQYVQEQRSTSSHIFTHLFLQLFAKTHLNKMLQHMTDVFPNCGIRFDSEMQKFQTLINQVQRDNLVYFAQTSAELWIERYFARHTISHDVTQSAHGFVADVKQHLTNLSILFPDQKRGLIKKQSILKQQDTGFNLQMEKIMVKKCRSLDTSDQISRSQVLNNVIKYFLKMMLQHVRRNSLISKEALQSLQIDLLFIVQIIYELVSVDEEGLIVGFYLEMIDSGAARCLEDGGRVQIIFDQQLDTSQVETISTNARNAIRL